MDNPSAKFEIIHEIVSQEGNLQNVRELCRIAGVSRSGYYRHLKASVSLKKKPTSGILTWTTPRRKAFSAT